jgi:hypothetical protein
MTGFNATATLAARPLPPMRRTPQRVTITLAWGTYQRLLERSDDEGRSLSNLAAHLLERGLGG